MSTSSKYNIWSLSLHWLMLFLLVAVYLAIELRELYPRGSDMRNAFKDWHFILGLSVWVLLLLRLVARFLHQTPVINPPLVKWQAIGSKIVHLLLYVFMLSMPLLGWLIVSYEGHTVVYFGIELPQLVVVNEAMAETLEDIHETVGEAGYWLVGFHALAALFHHYVVKDNTLKRMLPW